MIRYAAFQNFLWLWLVPAVAAVLAYGVWRRRRAMAAFVGAGSVSRLAGDLSLPRIWTKAACVVMAVGLLVFALSQPLWGTYWAQQRASGRDIIVALDVSRSMLADDVTPSRLDRAKEDIRDLVAAVEESGGHRLGLIAFAGTASVKCPLTQVTSHFKLVLDGLDSRSVAVGGTMIGDCIRAAIEAFDDKTQNFRDLILITDGEDMDSYPLEAAAEARDAGITIYTIGLGDAAQGARIPVADKSGRRSFLEHKGEVVWSKMDENTLKQIAQITGGIYVPAGTRAIELDRIFRDVIEPKTKRDLGETRREKLHHRFQWFLTPAVLLLMIESLIRETRRRTTALPLRLSSEESASPRRVVRQLIVDGSKPEAQAKERASAPSLVLQASTHTTRQIKIDGPLVGRRFPGENGLSAVAKSAREVPRSASEADAERHGGQSLPTGGSQQSVLPLVSLVFAAMLFGSSAAHAEDAGSLVREGNRLYEQGKFAEAAERYGQAATLAPESPVPLYNHAAALFQSRDFAGAAKLYEQARSRAPEEMRQQINFALGNSHLQQAIQSQAQPPLASQEAKSAVQFYRDAVSTAPPQSKATIVSDSARYNMELAKRLIKVLEQKQQQQQQQQNQDQQPEDQKGKQDQQSQPDPKQQQDNPQQNQQQPDTDNSQTPQQQPQSDSPETQAQEPHGSAQQLTPEEAAERLRSAIARAQTARARRLSEQAKQAKGKAVEKDW